LGIQRKKGIQKVVGGVFLSMVRFSLFFSMITGSDHG